MADVTMRPTFRFESKYEPNEALLKLKDYLESENASVSGSVFPSSAVIKTLPESTHFWSPQVQVSVEPFLPKGSSIHGLIGPTPTVWSIFVASYTFWSFVGVMGLIFASSQASIGQSSIALWVGPISLVGIIGTYLTARFGRGIATDQSRFLKQTLKTILE